MLFKREEKAWHTQRVVAITITTKNNLIILPLYPRDANTAAIKMTRLRYSERTNTSTAS